MGADTRGRHHSDFTKRRVERYVSGERMTAKGCRTAGYFADSETQPGKDGALHRALEVAARESPSSKHTPRCHYGVARRSERKCASASIPTRLDEPDTAEIPLKIRLITR